MADLRTAAELCPEPAGQADALADVAKIYQKQKDHRRAEAELKASALCWICLSTFSTSLTLCNIRPYVTSLVHIFWLPELGPTGSRRTTAGQRRSSRRVRCV